MNLMLAADLRVISTAARVLPGFQQIGIHPGGGAFTLPHRTAGREVAAALGLFGEEVSGARAVEYGLAWAAYDDDRVEAETIRWPRESRPIPNWRAAWCWRST